MIGIDILEDGRYRISGLDDVHYVADENELPEPLRVKMAILRATDVGIYVPDVGTRYARSMLLQEEGDSKEFFMKYKVQFLAAAIRRRHTGDPYVHQGYRPSEETGD